MISGNTKRVKTQHRRRTGYRVQT